MKVNPKKEYNVCQSCGKKTNKKVCNVCVGLVLKPIKEAEKSKLLVKGTKEFKAAKTEVKIGENRTELQRNINLLSRMIDARFGFNTCIDCGKPFGKQVDAAHFHNVKGNEHIRFNLHNLHSAKSDCNQYSSEHKVGYKQGLEQRYSIDYLDQVEALKTEVKELKLNAVEIAEKLKLVRHIIRNFDKYKFDNALIARNQFNKIIGIYG
jgi:hypothetical protein